MPRVALRTLDVDTAEMLTNMARHSRWSDERIARYLGIAQVHVERARKRVRRIASDHRVVHIRRPL